MTGDISGANASYSVNGGWSVSVPTPGSTSTPPQTTTVAVNNMSAKETSSFINGYNNAASMTGGIPGSTASYNPSAGWQVTTPVPGSNPPQTTTISVDGMSKNEVKNWIGDYNDAKKIADETGLQTHYDNDQGWQIIYNNGTEDKTINVSDFI
jgi:2,4-dienoyl-CoA reductase-like NADH-dependent reductase (Old Yellow Enzyme family)